MVKFEVVLMAGAARECFSARVQRRNSVLKCRRVVRENVRSFVATD
jgi:hypothetical protein